MNGSRNDAAPAGSERKDTQWPSAAAPHGYDRPEFGPGESRRDFPPRRVREADEERRLLKEAEAAFEGPDRREDIDVQDDGDAEDGVPSAESPSRLYRD
ncbi:hypothetical protein ABLE93_12440 [Xanthobacter sp. KR7-65]|uniref:hypothetical protein n=1 Tax=Xanthobacter sp. KR7-65 TaxID=3156612 RepID=UPI0032B471D3